ncbi:MAG: acyltransferase [Rhodanobacteraceae bacterium]|nr:acyltransferase [Rhodanobacteraceae bacterium]
MKRTPDDIPALTGLRGLATLWVLTHHFWEFIGFPSIAVGGLDLLPVIKNAYFGLDMFFVLSGFLVVRPYIRAAQGLGRMPSFGQDLLRRASVVPAYWANVPLSQCSSESAPASLR